MLFSHVEGWSFREGFYFAFITLSTIGFGDYVVGKNKIVRYLGMGTHWGMSEATGDFSATSSKSSGLGPITISPGPPLLIYNAMKTSGRASWLVGTFT
jgi:hypothetical protein